MAMATGRIKGPKSDINITPYIDILLVLLIIFMVIQPTTKYDLEARVPQKAEDQDIPKNVRIIVDTIVVSINADGSLLINAEPATRDNLGTRLFDIFSARANKNMFIRGAPDLPFGDVIQVIDIAKGAGVGDVGLITEEQTTGD